MLRAAIIRYALETNDPWLAELVRRADAGETVIDNLHVPETSEEKIEPLQRSSVAPVMNLQPRCWS